MKKTILYDEHIKLGAKMIPFADYYMPANYKNGIIEEYKSVRNNVGIFDVSHMGQIEISGKQSIMFLQNVTTNNIEKMKVGFAQYNLLCNENGGIIDDVIIYKTKNNTFMIIVNASNIEKDYNWLKNIEGYEIDIANYSNDFSLIAIQGPNSRKAMSEIFDLNLKNKFYTFINEMIFEKEILISRTGYTGELGYEILADHHTILKIWKKFIEYNIPPCGLAVRDTLRIEMKYCLYGSDINESINPIEAGLKWVVDLSKKNFIGKDFIFNSHANKPSKKMICFQMLDRGIPRKDYEIYMKNEKVGYVTSGTFSNTIQKGIGLGYINNFALEKYNNENSCDIKIRNKFIKAEIIKPPFIANFSLHK